VRSDRSEGPVERFYRRQAGIYDRTRWLFLRGRTRAVQALALEPGCRVLEIGCGTGSNFAAILSRLGPESGSLTGLDLTTDMLQRARRKATALGARRVDLVRGDAVRFTLPRKFDRLLFAYSLSLIPDADAAVARGLEHLRPGGRLAVVDFGQFERWGILARGIRAWLRLHHVRQDRPWARRLKSELEGFELTSHLGGQYILAVGRKPAIPFRP